MTNQTVLWTVDPRGVATVTLNRPEVNNAYDEALIQGLHEAMDVLAARKEVRVVVLRGAGRHFQAGADLKWIARVAAQSPHENERASRATALAVHRLNTLPVPTVALVLCALSFGGVMECTGLLNTLANAILKLAHSTGSLVLATIGSCIGTNIIAPDQYLSIVIPGRMYREAFRARGLHPKLLSRSVEDSGTLSSPLVPWNTCGAFMSTTLMVPTMAYVPYAFLNLLTPVVAVIIAFSGFRIAKLPEELTGRVSEAPDGSLSANAIAFDNQPSP